MDELRELAVLIVEDDEACGMILAEGLRIHGHRVEVVASAAEARRAIARHRPDVLLVDGHLGASDGLELVRALRRGPFGDTPVLLTTGRSRAEVAREAREAGIAQVLVKPIELAALIAAVDRAVRPGAGIAAS